MSNEIETRRGPDNELWCVVAHAADLASAEIPAGLLRSAHIPVYLHREAIGSSALPMMVGPFAGVDILVPEIYYEEALALLDADDGPSPELPPPEES